MPPGLELSGEPVSASLDGQTVCISGLEKLALGLPLGRSKLSLGPHFGACLILQNAVARMFGVENGSAQLQT